MNDRFKKNTLNVLIGATVSIAGISLLNKAIFKRATSRNLLYSEEKNFFNWRYGNVFYKVHGQGQPLLLIHGIGSGSSSYNYKEVSGQLAQHYRVYEIDLLGFGRSDKPQLTYTAYLYVQLINDFVKEVIKTKTHVIASSLSAAFVLMCNHQHDDIFDKIMLINPLSADHLMKYPHKLSNISRKLLETPLFGTTIFNFISSKRSTRKFLKENAFYNKKKVSRKMVDTFYESAHLGGVSAKYALASFMTRYMNTDIRQALSSTDKSIYIVWSKDEPFTNSSIIEQYQQLNPSIEYSLVDNAKLVPHFEQPDSFLEICDFYFG